MTDMQIENLSYSDAYAEFIMAFGTALVYNGDMLLELQESLYLFDEFVATLQK
jgi:hypothetical protein